MFRVGIIFLFFFFPTIALAQITISEIMYDLDGTDSDREWIEIYNNGSGTISLSGWRLFEADVNHNLEFISGGSSLNSGEYAVIADNSSTFLQDFPGYSGILVDSSFSLSNESETLEIRDADINSVSSITYSSSYGASGNGLSLHFDGSWQEGLPTPGSGPGNSDNNNDNQEDFQNNLSIDDDQKTPELHNISVNKENIAISGVPFKLSATANTSGSNLVRYFWNFGDGSTGEGKNEYHTFKYPGTYIVTLKGRVSGGDSITKKYKIKVISNPIILSYASSGLRGYITLENDSAYDIDVSRWRIIQGQEEFSFPENTFLASKTSLNFSASQIGFPVGPSIFLASPTGQPLSVNNGILPKVKTYSNTQKTSEYNQINDVEEAEISKNSNIETRQVAATSQSESGTIWPFAVSGVAGLAILGIFMMRPKKEPDEFDITET